MNPDPAAQDETMGNALIVAQMRPALVKYFKRKCGTVEEAEDLAQDVLLRALRHSTWKTPEQAKGYIFRAAVNRWRDRNRRALARGIPIPWEEATDGHFDEEISPERVLIGEEQLDNVAAALLQLPERTRDVFVLVRLEQLKQSRVAEILGVSVSTVEKELVKALAHLARCAKRWGGVP